MHLDELVSTDNREALIALYGRNEEEITGRGETEGPGRNCKRRKRAWRERSK